MSSRDTICITSQSFSQGGANNLVQKKLHIKSKVQVISYETPDGSLGKTYATSDKRISISESRDILSERGIEFREILKVKYEIIDLFIPLDTIETFTTENTQN